MSNEFYIKYNGIDNLKKNEFESSYLKGIVDNYNKLDSLKNMNDALLKYGWYNIIQNMDTIVKKCDSINSWWSNYLENLKNLENSLPEKGLSISNISTNSYYVDHTTDKIYCPDING